MIGKNCGVCVFMYIFVVLCMLVYHMYIVSSVFCIRACMYCARAGACIYTSTICVCACVCVCVCVCVCEWETFQPGGYCTDLLLARF